MALPKVKYEPDRLYRFFYENCQVTKTEISVALQCCFGTADKVFNETKKQMAADGIPQYHPQKVAVDSLYKLYGWDIKRIERAVKALAIYTKGEEK